MAFDQSSSTDSQYYSGIRTAGSSAVYGTTHLYVPQDTGRIQVTKKILANGTVQSRWTILDECSTLGELLRTELSEHKDVLCISYTTGEAAEQILTIECLTRVDTVKELFQSVCKKINMELYGLYQALSFSIQIQTNESKSVNPKNSNKITIFPSSPNNPLLLKGKVHHVKTSLVNGLRRVILEDLPNLAIHTIRIKESKCILDDGALSDRLALVPIDCTAIDTLLPKSKCDCDEYCSKCSATLKLKEKHPIDSKSLHPWMITDLDLKVDNTHPLIKPATQSINNEKERFEKRINLAPLAPGQEIELECVVKWGIGREHAKFKPACRVQFVPNQTVKINYDMMNELQLTQQEKEWFVQQCPTKVFDIENSHIVIKDHDRCTACQACTRASRMLINKRIPEITVKERMANNTLKPLAEFELHGQDDTRTDFRFVIQSVGGMKPLEIFKRGINVLVEKILVFSNDLNRCVI